MSKAEGSEHLGVFLAAVFPCGFHTHPRGATGCVMGSGLETIPHGPVAVLAGGDQLTLGCAFFAVTSPFAQNPGAARVGESGGVEIGIMWTSMQSGFE